MKRRRGLTNLSTSAILGDDIQTRTMGSTIWNLDLLPADLSLIQPFENISTLNSAYMGTAGPITEWDDQFNNLLPPELAELTDIFSVWSQHSAPPLPEYNGTTPSKEHIATHLQKPDNFAVGQATPSRPIDLLNTALGADEIESELISVYDTVFGRCASRFLSCRNNIFSGSSPYCFDHELRQSPAKSELDSTQESLLLNEDNLRGSVSDLSGNQEVGATRITLIGIARFLDNFGGLFGNPLTKTEQMAQERTLAAVCKAFAIQWLPISSTGSERTSVERFTAAWRDAHGRLTKLKYTTSFRRIFAILLFQMTSRPQDARFDAQDHASPEALLNCALLELQHLASRVRKYCEDLSPTSRYRTLLEISLSAIQWWAYLRDTSTSISTDRPCVLPYPPCREDDYSDYIDFSDNTSFPIGLCEQETGELLVLYRHVIGFRSVLEKSSGTAVGSHSSLAEAIGKCIEATAITSAKYLRWLKNLESGYPRISREAQASSSLLLMFWSLAVLCFVEQLDSIEERWSVLNPEYSIKRDAYRSIAVSCMIRTAQVVEEARLHKIFDEEFEFKTDDPSSCLIHASSEFVVTAIVKGIHHTLAMNAAGQSMFECSSPQLDDRMAASHPLSVAPLVALLSGMTETVSGSLSAAFALQELVQEHGDAMMDCCV
jgi:hypothetical protein